MSSRIRLAHGYRLRQVVLLRLPLEKNSVAMSSAIELQEIATVANNGTTIAAFVGKDSPRGAPSVLVLAEEHLRERASKVMMRLMHLGSDLRGPARMLSHKDAIKIVAMSSRIRLAHGYKLRQVVPHLSLLATHSVLMKSGIALQEVVAMHGMSVAIMVAAQVQELLGVEAHARRHLPKHLREHLRGNTLNRIGLAMALPSQARVADVKHIHHLLWNGEGVHKKGRTVDPVAKVTMHPAR